MFIYCLRYVPTWCSYPPGLEALKARGGRVTEEELQKYCTAMAKIEKHSHLGTSANINSRSVRAI